MVIAVCGVAKMLGLAMGRDGVFQVCSGDVQFDKSVAYGMEVMQTPVWRVGEANKLYQTRAHSI